MDAGRLFCQGNVESALNQAVQILEGGILEARELEPEACGPIILNSLKIVARAWMGRMTTESTIDYIFKVPFGVV